MSLKDLIPHGQWQLLQKKYPHLDQSHYVCRCETCNAVFFDELISKVQEMLKSGEWDPRQAASQLWYIQAARHWVPQTFHSIRVYVTHEGDRTLVKDLSAEWTAQIPAQKRTVEKLNQVKKQKVTFEQAMLNELDYLEKQIKQRT